MLRRTTPPAPETAQARLWRAMRILRRFSRDDLRATCDAGRMCVHDYIAALMKAGYLRKVSPGRPFVYLLTRDTGPKPPRASYDGALFDSNVSASEVPDAA